MRLLLPSEKVRDGIIAVCGIRSTVTATEYQPMVQLMHETLFRETLLYPKEENSLSLELI